MGDTILYTGNLLLQKIENAIVGQDIDIIVSCYAEDGVTQKDMSGESYKLTFHAEDKSGSSTGAITKTSENSEILFADPDNYSIKILIKNTDIPDAIELHWKLSGTDLSDDNEFVAAVGTWKIEEWA